MWTDEWTEIADLDSDERSGVTKLYAKEFPDGWHYAIVHWFYHSPSVLLEFANGKTI